MYSVSDKTLATAKINDEHVTGKISNIPTIATETLLTYFTGKATAQGT